MFISGFRNGNVPFDLIEIFYAMKVWYFFIIIVSNNVAETILVHKTCENHKE